MEDFNEKGDSTRAGAGTPIAQIQREFAAGAFAGTGNYSPVPSAAASVAAVSPTQNAEPEENDAEPRPNPPDVNQFQLARLLRPIRNVQSDYMTFNGYRYVNYHSQVYHGVADADMTLSWVLLLKVGLPDSFETYKLDSSKRVKAETKTRTYRRNYTFANLLSNGNVVVFLEMGINEQHKNLHYLDKFRVGDQFNIIEPDATNPSFISNSMPIIKTDFQFIPVALPPPQLLPRIDVPDVMRLNTSKFFIIHNAIVTFTGVNIVKSNCTYGNLCDFRVPEAKGCCCWHQRGRQMIDADYVLKLNVSVQYVDKMGHTKMLPRTKNWSSQHFTDLVFDYRMPLEPLALNQDQVLMIAIRRKMKELEDYVNSVPECNRGWTVIGWYKRGLTTDAAAKQATTQNDDKVAATEVNTKMHLVRIHPTHITRDELRMVRKLLPAKYLGTRADINQIKAENDIAMAAELADLAAADLAGLAEQGSEGAQPDSTGAEPDSKPAASNSGTSPTEEEPVRAATLQELV